MTSILGISAFYHDSAAALVVDGKIIAAAQEERFTRKKHDAAFPARAIECCLAEANLSPDQLDYVAFYEKPLLKFDRLIETYLAFAPRGFASFCKAIPIWLREKLYLSKTIRTGLGNTYTKRFLYPEHHESHAASAFFPSPFQEAAILTIDGVGEWATTTLGHGKDNRITLTHELRFPHSLGMLYSAFTYFCGFKVNSGEYKLMGLAPYGVPKYVDVIFEKILDLKEDGSFRLNLDYFDYCHKLKMTSRKIDQLFGGPPRQPETEFTQRELDLAASVQQATELIVMRMAQHLAEISPSKNLCLAGGVALNCVANGRLLREGPFENIWIQPAAGDAGGALGAALFVWYQLLGEPRIAKPEDDQQGSFLGPKFDLSAAEDVLKNAGIHYRKIDSPDDLASEVVQLLAAGKVVGWFEGRMEFGPRALGNRSILGDARNQEMQTQLNLKIKFRESFRPFAPLVLEHRVQDYFEPGVKSPYMLLVSQVHPDKLTSASNQTDEFSMLDRRKILRSDIPAITHVDNSARLQTVDPVRHPRLHQLLTAFEAQTECPVLINTSFNIRGEPIVCTPDDALHCFLSTQMDVLVLDRFLVLKEDQEHISDQNAEEYREQFPLD